jgi:hypothetical protein
MDGGINHGYASLCNGVVLKKTTGWNLYRHKNMGLKIIMLNKQKSKNNTHNMIPFL